MARSRQRVDTSAAVGVVIVLALAVLVVKWLLITAAILAIPFGAWWLWDRARQTRPVGPVGPVGPSPSIPAPRPTSAGVPVGASGTPLTVRSWSPATAPPLPAGFVRTGPGTGPTPAAAAPHRARHARATTTRSVAHTASHLAATRTAPAALAPETQVTVTREEDHQDVLARHHRRIGGSTPIVVELVSGTVTRGKYAGRYAVEVRVGGERVGELTAGMSERYADLVLDAEGRGGAARANALVDRSPRGFQVVVRLPRREALRT